MASLKVPEVVPSPLEDAEQLRKAFGGWGTNEHLIISILAHRNAQQRKLIRQAYADSYGEDLLKALDKELSSEFERAVLLWTLDPAERDALLAYESTRLFTSNLWVLVEIACTRSTHDLFQVRKAYHARYKRSIEEDIAHHAKGDYRKLLVPLVSSLRYEGDEVNTRLAKAEAEILREKITGNACTDDDFIRIISTRTIWQDLKADPEDEYLKLLRSVIKCLTVPEKYFEKVLRQAINKLGTDEWALTRVITTRAEVDLKRIAEEYHRRNSIPLVRAIDKDTSGDYEKLLIELTGDV